MAENNRNWDQQSGNQSEDWNQDRSRFDQYGQDQNRYHQGNYGDQLKGGYGGSEYGNTYYRADYNNDERRINSTSNNNASRQKSYNSSGDNRQDEQYSQRRQGGYGNQSGYYGGGSYGNDYNSGYGRVGNTGGSFNDTGWDGQSGNDDQRGYNTGGYRENRNANSGSDRTSNRLSSWENNRNNDERRNAGEHRGKGPKGYQRSADRIREDICDRLSDDPFIDASDIDIKIEGSEVVLTGVVDSKDAKRRAEDLVESVSGVRNVENRIRVDKDRGANSNPGFYTNANDVGEASGTTREIIRDQNENNNRR